MAVAMVVCALGCRPQASPATVEPRPAADVPPREGVMDKDDIRRVVRANLHDVAACYKAGLAEDPSLTGRVTLQFTIGPRGAVTRSAVEGTTLPRSAAAVGTCIAFAAETWRFPRPIGGGNVVVTYPFVLVTEASEGAAPEPVLYGLGSSRPPIGTWSEQRDGAPDTLLVEVRGPDGQRQAHVEVTLELYDVPGGPRQILSTDATGRVVFTGVPARGRAAVTVGSTRSATLPLDGRAWGTSLVIP